MGMAKKDYSWIDMLLESEKRKLPPHVNTAESLELAYPKNKQVRQILSNALRYANALDFAKVKETLKQLPDGVRCVDIKSTTGIPDFIAVYESFAETEEEERQEDDNAISFLASYSDADIIRFIGDAQNIKIPYSKANGQILTGSCNVREEESVKFASRLSNISFSAFVAKATLYMARFIYCHRRNEEGHPYHPGEAYLFMEHGEKMQDAFTPDEVRQAMEKAGISGSRVASDIMAELERLRDARMNPEAGSMDVPE